MLVHPGSGQLSYDIAAPVFDQGIWLDFVDSDGYCAAQTEPTTPGTDFWKFRNILGSIAHEFRHELNPALLRADDVETLRIEHVAHELSNEDRNRAGNATMELRARNGRLWERIHQFVKMPVGTDEQEAAWKAERDAIDALLLTHCSTCHGEGVGYRYMDRHPVDEHKFYLESGVLVDADASFNATAMSGPLLTEAQAKLDVRNNRAAAQYFRKACRITITAAPARRLYAQPLSLFPLTDDACRCLTANLPHGAQHKSDTGSWLTLPHKMRENCFSSTTSRLQ